MPFPIHSASLELASVTDAHNQGAIVQFFGEARTGQVLYDADLQAGGVIIRPCHLVVVDTARQPGEIVWRIGTRGLIRARSEESITLDLGYQSITIPLDDLRPDEEKLETPLTIGMEVLLHGRIDRARVYDIFLDGELAHPERLKRHLAEVIAQHATSQP